MYESMYTTAGKSIGAQPYNSMNRLFYHCLRISFFTGVKFCSRVKFLLNDTELNYVVFVGDVINLL